MFLGRPAARPCDVPPLEPIARDAISLYLVEEFQRNLAQYSPCECALLKRFSKGQ